MTRSVLPGARRRRRFGEGRAAGAGFIVLGVLVGTASYLLGRALRAGDDNLINF